MCLATVSAPWARRRFALAVGLPALAAIEVLTVMAGIEVTLMWPDNSPQLEASLRDQPTHNMVSIPRYARRISAGTINPRPVIRVERETGVVAQVDRDNGPGQWVAVVAMETAIRIAREKGVGIVGVRRSNHLGAAGHYPRLAAREGLNGLCTTTGPVILAPTGGVTPTFGNNPLGVGIPARRDGTVCQTW